MPETTYLDTSLLIRMPRGGFPSEPRGHCVAVEPAMNPKLAQSIQIPVLGSVARGCAKTMGVIDTFYNGLFSAAATLDQSVFADGIDRMTGLNQLSPLLQGLLRWGERGIVAAFLTGTFYTGQGSSFRAGLQQSWGFWKPYLPLLSVIVLASTQMASHASKILTTIDPEHKIFQDNSLSIARLSCNGLLYAGGFFCLLWKGGGILPEGYRKVVMDLHKGTPQAAKALSLKWGAIGVGALAGWMWLCDNWAAQHRMLMAEGKSIYSTYNPLNWKPEYLYSHVSAAGTLGWGFAGGAAVALMGWQTKATNFLTKPFGFDNTIYALNATEQSFIQRGRFGFTRALRAILPAFFTKKRFAYATLSTIVGLPMMVGLIRALMMVQAFSSGEALSGTSLRSFATGPMYTGGMVYLTALNGHAHGLTAYFFNMFPVNFPVESCTKRTQSLWQASRPLVDDYMATKNEDKQRHIRTLLANLLLISQDTGSPVPKQNERLLIRKELERAGIDWKQIETLAASA